MLTESPSNAATPLIGTTVKVPPSVAVDPTVAENAIVTGEIKLVSTMPAGVTTDTLRPKGELTAVFPIAPEVTTSSSVETAGIEVVPDCIADDEAVSVVFDEVAGKVRSEKIAIPLTAPDVNVPPRLGPDDEIVTKPEKFVARFPYASSART